MTCFCIGDSVKFLAETGICCMEHCVCLKGEVFSVSVLSISATGLVLGVTGADSFFIVLLQFLRAGSPLWLKTLRHLPEKSQSSTHNLVVFLSIERIKLHPHEAHSSFLLSQDLLKIF